LMRKGLARPQDAEHHPDRNKLFNCLGSPTAPTIELSRRVSLQAGDRLLLCSDGLWSALPEPMLLSLLVAKPVMEAVPELIRMALSLAGDTSDNVTALAMSWEGIDSLPLDVEPATLALEPGMSPTIQATPSDAARELAADAAELSDEDIQRAIDEIRESIRRANHSQSSELAPAGTGNPPASVPPSDSAAAERTAAKPPKD